MSANPSLPEGIPGPRSVSVEARSDLPVVMGVARAAGVRSGGPEAVIDDLLVLEVHGPIYGYRDRPSASMVGRRLSEVLPGPLWAQLVDQLTDAVAGQRTVRAICHIDGLDVAVAAFPRGEEVVVVWAEITASRLDGAEGRRAGVREATLLAFLGDAAQGVAWCSVERDAAGEVVGLGVEVRAGSASIPGLERPTVSRTGGVLVPATSGEGSDARAVRPSEAVLDLAGAALACGARREGDIEGERLVAVPVAGGVGIAVVGTDPAAVEHRPPPSDPAVELSPREREILELLAEGLGTPEIAARLYLSRNTVRNHVRRLLHRLGVQSRLEAVVVAARSGLIRIDSER